MCYKCARVSPHSHACAQLLGWAVISHSLQAAISILQCTGGRVGRTPLGTLPAIILVQHWDILLAAQSTRAYAYLHKRVLPVGRCA